MTNGIPAEYYKDLTPAEADVFDAYSQVAWQNELIPIRQYVEVVYKELGQWRDGGDVLPYRVLMECLKKLPPMGKPTLLDVGASTGYYGEVLGVAGFDCHYTAMDFSPTFQRLARALYPRIRFDLGDARELPYGDDEFDIVLSGAVMMHVREYQKVISEAERVAKKYVIFHRTPITNGEPTRMYAKEAYGVPCLEIRFNQDELMQHFADAKLSLVYSYHFGADFRTYLLSKQ